MIESEWLTTCAPNPSLKALAGKADVRKFRLFSVVCCRRIWEVDAEGGEAALRSREPSTRDEVRTYYEVRLRREGTLDLRRVAYDPADRRRRVACQLTREALERLADDLVATVA